jgi:hypothetical protein
MSPKIGHALTEIESVYAGQEATHAYFDHKNKVYVLVVYNNAVKAIHDLALNSRRIASKNHT